MKRKFSLLFLLCWSAAQVFAQNRQISGRVTSDSSNAPLVGVSVSVKGTKTTKATDANGVYQISVPPSGNPVLIFSAIGFTTVEQAVGNKKVINISLANTSTSLSDVVVVGYATVSRKDLTGAVSSVTAKQLKDVPVASLAEALQGRLAGVQLTRTDGAPGAEMLIRVRGGGSITQDNSPLYIVDGVQVENALSVLSPQDIASIDVLKDASTTAIYGARGANGVVVITTKSGRPGKTQVVYNGSMGFKKLPKFLPVLEPYDFVLWQYERSRGNLDDSISFSNTYGTTWDTLNVYKDYPFQNWQEQAFGRTAGFQNHNVSVSGGTQNTTLNLSLTANKEDGIQINSGFKRYMLNFKMEHKISDKARVGLIARYLNQNVLGAGTADQGGREASRLRHAITYRPIILNRPGFGEDEFDLAYQQRSVITNPVLATRSDYRNQSTNGTYLTGFITYNLLKNLTFRSTVGYDNVFVQTDRFWDKISSTANRYANLPLASIGQQKNNTINNSNTLQYNLDGINKKHDISLLVGQEIVQVKSKQNTTETRYFPADITAEKALANMGLGSVPSGSTAQQPMPTSFVATPQRIFSVFSRVSYAFEKKYLFNFNIRHDRSSKFTPDNSLLISPSGSIGWRISSEKFMQNVHWVNDAKLRFGYGQVGNNRISNNLYLQLYGVEPAYALNHSVLPGFAPTALANPNLMWEKNITRNLGLDISILKNRLQFTVDVYKNSANNLLLNVKIPGTTGYTDQIQNVGSLSNRGVEFQFNGTPVTKRNFSWTSNFNISFNKNRVEDLGGVDFVEKATGWQGGGEVDYIVKVGSPVGQMYGYYTDGFYKIEDFDYNATTQTYTLKTKVPNNSALFNGQPQPGWIKLKDLNGDGIVDPADKRVIGDANPKFTGGWNNQFTYKNFDLSVFVNFVYGNDIYHANKWEFTWGGFNNLNMLQIMKDRWTNINANGQVVRDPVELAALNANAKIWTPIRSERWPLHTWVIEDGSYLRLNNLTLGYTLPKQLMNRAKINSLRVYATVNNLATLTNYTGYDPDVNTRRSDPLTPGVDFAGYPNARIWTFGVNLTL